jgi:hypothetical protein
VASSIFLTGTGQKNSEGPATWTTAQFSKPNETNITYLGISFRPEEHQIIPYSQRGEIVCNNCLIVDFDPQNELVTEKPFPVISLIITQIHHQQ